MTPNGFTAVAPKALKDNFFHLLDDAWALLCAGDETRCNGMTVSWGNTGILWNKEVAICYARPQRYTRPLLDDGGVYTLCFFEDSYRAALKLCGTQSGRDMDKFAAAGLTPVRFPGGGMGVQEASLVLECRILYRDQIREESFVDRAVEQKNYPQKDYHYFYIGEIVGCWRK